MDSKPILNTEDVFEDSYKEFQETSLFDRLDDKFKPIPYYKKYRPLRWIALISSYLFNVFSGLTSSLLVYYFAYELTNNWIIASLITTAFIVILETSKRKTSSIFFKDVIQYRKINVFLLGFGLILTGMSISCSYFGSKRIVKELSEPRLIDVEQELKPLRDELIQLDTQIVQARETRWLGTTTSASQKAIVTLTEQKAIIQSQLFKRESDLESQNDVILKTHQTTTSINANHFALVTLLLELLFVMTAFYLEYYDFRSYLEFATVKTKQDDSDNNDDDSNDNCENNPITVYTTEITEDCVDNGDAVNTEVITKEKIIYKDITSETAIRKAISHVKGRISSARYRLAHNIGRRETSEKNIEKFEQELEELKSMLVSNNQNTLNNQLELDLERET